MVRRKETQRIFDVEGHVVYFKQVKNVEEAQFTGMAQNGPEFITKQQSWVEVTAECDNCHRIIELTLNDNNREIAMARRYLLGSFVESACINQKT